MKIISFDVGIKNMALCLFQTIPSVDAQILQWDILNLCAADTTADTLLTKTLCSFCKKKAAYFRTPPNSNSIPTLTLVYYCKKHAQIEICPPKKWSSLSKEALVLLAAPKQSTFPPEHVAWNKKQWIAWIQQEMIQRLVPNKNKKTSELSLIDIGRTMTTLLDTLLVHHSDITHVLIENQISPIASRMKTIQGMLAQYFILRIPNAHIEFVSSHNKMTLIKTNPNNPVKNLTKENKYKENKRLSVEKVQEWILGSSWETFFQQSKKKDDLADCLLQGLWFVKVKNQEV